MFSEILNDSIINKVEKIGNLKPINQKELFLLLEKCINGKCLKPDEIIELINGTQVEENKKIILDFSANYRRPHDQEILLLPPLYFSNKCENDCLYCNFSSDGVCLSYNEFQDEFNTLLDMGYRSIELVSSQDPDMYLRYNPFNLNDQIYNIDNVADYFKFARKKLVEKGIGMLTSNIPPLDLNSFKKLKSSGLDCYLLWLETFNPYQYSKLHNNNNPKGNQAFRLDSFENAISAGVEYIAVAFLKGLYDWKKEEAALYLFNQYLKTKNGRGFSIIGTPRLKGTFARSELVSPYLVSDEDYELNIALDRILFDGILWLQTREPFYLNRRLINKYGAGIILTLNCSTAPGGYKKPPKGRAQFPVYQQEISEALSVLENDGYKVIFNWDSGTLADFQRKNSLTKDKTVEKRF